MKQARSAGDANSPQGAPPAPTPVTASPAQGTATPGEGASEGPGFVLPSDRLPLGKQEVVLSVDVQAPANLIFNREATVKIIVKNSGSTDAQGVMVRDELPAGLTFVSSQPEAQRVGDSHLSWRISTLPAGSDRVILLKVKPSKTDGALDHAATVTFQAGSKATSRVLRPRLKLEVVQTPTEGKVLKNKTAEFRIAVTNSGNGPARNVIVKAKLSPGLRHDTGERNEDNSFELPIQELGPGQREDLDPLTVEAIQGGAQSCTVTATSDDVDLDKESAEVIRNLEVVEPKLKMTLTGPDKRYHRHRRHLRDHSGKPGHCPGEERQGPGDAGRQRPARRHSTRRQVRYGLAPAAMDHSPDRPRREAAAPCLRGPHGRDQRLRGPRRDAWR